MQTDQLPEVGGGGSCTLLASGASFPSGMPVWHARLYIATRKGLISTGDFADAFHHSAGHSAGAAPNTPTDVDRGEFCKNRHPTNHHELVSQFILNPWTQKVLVMNSEACSLLQLCNSEQNVTTWSSAVAQQWFPKIVVDQGISRINDTLSALQCSTLAAALGWHVRSAPPVAPKHDWEHPCVLLERDAVRSTVSSSSDDPFSDTGCCRGRKDCGSEAVKALERDTRASFVRAHGRSPMSRIRKKQTLLLVQQVALRLVDVLLATVASHVIQVIDCGVRDLRCGSQHASSKRMAGERARMPSCNRAQMLFRESQSRFQRQISEAAVRPESSDSERNLESISISIDGHIVFSLKKRTHVCDPLRVFK